MTTLRFAHQPIRYIGDGYFPDALAVKVTVYNQAAPDRSIFQFVITPDGSWSEMDLGIKHEAWGQAHEMFIDLNF